MCVSPTKRAVTVGSPVVALQEEEGSFVFGGQNLFILLVHLKLECWRGGSHAAVMRLHVHVHVHVQVSLGDLVNH